jgi:TetR/AcrR family transcriptional regulator, regulator of autoinduction and epiphytic fitness
MSKDNLCSANTKPTLLQRRQARLINAATEAFLEFGYDATSMDLIADRAEIARRTLYNYFPTKNELFIAAAEFTCRRLASVMEVDYDPRRSAQQQLTSYCLAIAEGIIEPQHVDAVRLMCQVAKHSPDLARALRETTTEVFQSRLSNFLSEIVIAGKLSIPSRQIRQAMLLLSAVTMMPLISVLTGQSISRAIEPDITKMIEDSVELFCEHYKPRRRKL